MKKRTKDHKNLLLSCEKVRDLQPLNAGELVNAVGGGTCVFTRATEGKSGA